MKIKCPFMAHTTHYLPDGTQVICIYEERETNTGFEYWMELDDVIRFLIRSAGWHHL